MIQQNNAEKLVKQEKMQQGTTEPNPSLFGAEPLRLSQDVEKQNGSKFYSKRFNTSYPNK